MRSSSKSSLLAIALFIGATLQSAPDSGAPSLAGQRVLWLGDSITQAGDYVTFAEYYLERAFPREKFDIISIGRSGETTSGLSEKASPFPRPCVHDRLARALDLAKPSVVIACYGMNDGIYHPASPERMWAFQGGVRKLLDVCHAAGARVILLTPPPFDRVPGKTLLPKEAPDFSYQTPYEDYDDVLADFAHWETTLPASVATTIDLHGTMRDYLAAHRRIDPAFAFVKDGVHPNAAGHLFMAQTVLRGLGIPLAGADADLSKELVRIQADPLYQLVKKQREARSDAWLPYVGLPGNVELVEDYCGKLQAEIDRMRAP